MTYKKLIIQTTFLISCIALALHAELPLTHIKGLAAPFRTSRQAIVVTPSTTGPATSTADIAERNVLTDDNIFSPIYGALAWHSPYLLNLWQNDSESATANLVQQLFNLQFDGVTFDISGIPGNTISHLSCENIGYIIGLLYNYEQSMNAYAKKVTENAVQLQAELVQQGEASPRTEQQRTPSPGIAEQGAGSPQRSKAGKKSPQPITPFQEKQRTFSAYKNEEPLRIKAELAGKLTAYLETLNPAAVKQNIITYYSSQIAHLDADIAREQDVAKIQVLQRKKIDLESKLTTEQAANSNTIVLRAYSEGKNAFVKDFVASMLDTRYLPHNTILLLLSCMWKKANSYEDIMHYMYGVYNARDNKTEPATQPIISYETFRSTLMPTIMQPPYTAIEYKSLLQRNPAELYTNLADYAFAFFGFDLFDDNATLLPPEVGMTMRARYGETEFPDCGETSLMNFFAAILYNPTEKNWNIDLLNKINADQKLTQFFIDFSPSTLNTQDTHNRWAQVVSGKVDVDYTRANRCEINAGMDNMLKVIAALIPGANTFEDLARILNSNGVQIAFDIPTGVNKYGEIAIRLTKNEHPLTLIWKFNSGHFHLSFPPKVVVADPRTPLLRATPFNDAIAKDMLLQALLIHYNMQPLDVLQVMHYYQAFVYDIQSPQDLLKMVKRIALLQETNLYKIPLIRSLYNTLLHKQIVLDDQNMYQREFWDIIKETNTNPENMVLDKDIASMTDNQKEHYIEVLLSQTITNTIAKKIQKIISTILDDGYKQSIIQTILRKDLPTYAFIIPILLTIQDDDHKSSIIETILRKDPTTPLVQQLYALIIPMLSTIQDDGKKTFIIQTILQKDPTAAGVQQLYESIIPILSTIQDDEDKYVIISNILRKDPTAQLVQQLYESIIPILSTIRIDQIKVYTIMAILQEDPGIPAVQQLYIAIKQLVMTMQKKGVKSKIRELLLQKDQSIPVVQELLQPIQ